MLAIERRQHILDSVARRGRVIVAELSAEFAVSDETIRRDLQRLEREGAVSRTHGGAVLRPEQPEDLPYGTRQVTNIAQKRRIAARAAALVRDGDAVMLDSSTTAYEVLEGLAERRELTLITNSVRILASPAARPHGVISAGGELRHQSLTLGGQLAIEAIARFRANIAFISCKALSAEGGVMDASMPDAEIKRAFIAHARHVCLLVDGDKFDGTGLISVCPPAAVQTIITDRRPAERWCALLAAAGVRLLHD